MKAKCKVCGYVYDDNEHETKFSALPETWQCPICGVPKSLFEIIENDDLPQSAPAKQTSSDIIIKTLTNCGVKWAFGMVGHSNLGMAEAIRNAKEHNEINFITTRHEGAASFAASAYGKLTNRPASVLTIAGPGATNLMTGLYDAKLDKSPLIALTGQVPTKDMGQYIFQEIDLNSCFKDVAERQLTMQSGIDFSTLAIEAYRSAIEKRGVAQIIMPDDAQTLSTTDSPRELKISQSNKLPISQNDIDAIISLLKSKRRPIILIGNGAKNCAQKILSLAEKMNCAIVETYRAKGFLSDDNPLVCGVTGRSGTLCSSAMLNNSDVIISFGAMFSRHTSIPEKLDIVQIDNNPTSLGKLCKPTIPVLADCECAVDALSNAIDNAPTQFSFVDQRSEIVAQKKSWEDEKSKRANNTENDKINDALACKVLSELIPANAIVSVDVGNVAYSFGRYFEAKAQRFLLSWYLGSIGVGLPSAIGAACATKEDGEFFNRKVVAIVGDGGLGQYLADFSTLVKYNLNVCVVVFNNSELGKISLEQRAAGMKVWETSLANPNFAEYAKACGAFGARVKTERELRDSLQQAIALNAPSLVEIMM